MGGRAARRTPGPVPRYAGMTLHMNATFPSIPSNFRVSRQPVARPVRIRAHHRFELPRASATRSSVAAGSRLRYARGLRKVLQLVAERLFRLGVRCMRARMSPRVASRFSTGSPSRETLSTVRSASSSRPLAASTCARTTAASRMWVWSPIAARASFSAVAASCARARRAPESCAPSRASEPCRGVHAPRRRRDRPFGTADSRSRSRYRPRAPAPLRSRACSCRSPLAGRRDSRRPSRCGSTHR